MCRIHRGQRLLGSLQRMTPLEVTRPTRPGLPEQSHCWCVPSPSSGKAGIEFATEKKFARSTRCGFLERQERFGSVQILPVQFLLIYAARSMRYEE